MTPSDQASCSPCLCQHLSTASATVCTSSSPVAVAWLHCDLRLGLFNPSWTRTWAFCCFWAPFSPPPASCRPCRWSCRTHPTAGGLGPAPIAEVPTRLPAGSPVQGWGQWCFWIRWWRKNPCRTLYRPSRPSSAPPRTRPATCWGRGVQHPL